MFGGAMLAESESFMAGNILFSNDFGAVAERA